MKVTKLSKSDFVSIVVFYTTLKIIAAKYSNM